MKRFACLILAALMALSLAACGTQKRETLELFAMDTYMTFVAIGDGADDVLTDLSRTVNTLESSLSRTVDTSEVSRLNRDGSAVWDEDGAQLLSWALQHSQETDGAFDITIAPLVELWGITSDSPRVPSQAEIDALLPLVGYEHVHQSEFCSISLDEGCSVDLGGIAKGYASDCAAVLFHRSALTGGCANLGGNVYVYGTNAQNKPWSVAIQDPAASEGYVCTLSLSDAFVVTSGGYQRYFTALDGTVYLLDLQQKTYEKNSPYSSFQYECYYFPDIPARVMFTDKDGALCFGTADGKLCRFASSLDSPASYNDDGEAITAYWDTADFDGNLFFQTKSFTGVAARLAAAPVTGVKIYALVRGIWKQVYDAKSKARYLSFEYIDFAKFTFSGDQTPRTLYGKVKLKKVDKVRFRLRNDEVNEPFGLYAFGVQYKEPGTNYRR